MDATGPESIRKATPCDAARKEMDGEGPVYLCKECKRRVYDFGEMSGAEASALVAEEEGETPATLFVREDGIVMSGDCPVGLREKRDLMIWQSVLLAGMLVVTAFVWSKALTEVIIFPDPIAIHAADIGGPGYGGDTGKRFNPKDYEFCAEHGEYHLWAVRYDPSNGTLSRGDITRNAKGIFKSSHDFLW